MVVTAFIQLNRSTLLLKLITVNLLNMVTLDLTKAKSENSFYLALHSCSYLIFIANNDKSHKSRFYRHDKYMLIYKNPKQKNKTKKTLSF